MTDASPQHFMNRTDFQRQRQRELEEWVHQTTFAALRQPYSSKRYLEMLDKANKGHTQAAIYALVGTKRQVEGFGLIRQVENGLEWCVKHGYLITEADFFLEVGSGSRVDRPVLQRLLSLCSNRRYKVIVIESADRWWQGPMGEADPLFDRLEAAGTRLETVWGNPPVPLTAAIRQGAEAEAEIVGQALARLLAYAEASGQPLEAIARLWIGEGEEAVSQLVELHQKDVTDPPSV